MQAVCLTVNNFLGLKRGTAREKKCVQVKDGHLQYMWRLSSVTSSSATCLTLNSYLIYTLPTGHRSTLILRQFPHSTDSLSATHLFNKQILLCDSYIHHKCHICRGTMQSKLLKCISFGIFKPNQAHQHSLGIILLGTSLLYFSYFLTV